MAQPKHLVALEEKKEFRYLHPFTLYCVEGHHIWIFFGPNFPAARVTRKFRVNFFIQPECRKMRAKKTPNTAIFHTSLIHYLFFSYVKRHTEH